MICSQALTRIQTLIILAVIVFSSFAGVWVYTQSVNNSNPAPFSIEVIARPFIPLHGENQLPIAIPEQRMVFLVSVDDSGYGKGFGEAVEISATVSEATVFVNNPTIKPGEIAEINLMPTQANIDKVLTLVITGTRNGTVQTKSLEIEVLDRNDSLQETTSEMKDMFISWLSDNRPELGISNETEWDGTIVNPGILVVMHYMFFSEDWEMYVTWHVMIPPYDWVKIYLRPRFSETQSTMAFEISSIQGAETPHSIELPDWL